MKRRLPWGILPLLLITFLLFARPVFSQSFSQSVLDFNGLGDVSNGVTSMMFGPDGRLYVAEYPGQIKILTINRLSSTNYQVTDVEVLTGVSSIPNHDDDGTACSGGAFACNSRETTGLTVAGTSTNPVIYVTSSDFRIGAGPGGGNGDVNLDTNSGIITRFTWNGSSWEVVDIVRGLPRSEENHATNGLEFATINGTDYLLVASGGHTNAGGPSVNFVFQCEYALSGAVLSVNLDMIEGMPILNDSGRSYIYDLPTLDDPTRANANGITDPDTPGYNGIDINDPWGGNDGLNQAIVDPSGPVQIYSPGYRNAYDVVLTESGALYATDNGANGGWGGFPVNEGGGSATNAYDPTEPGSQSPSGGEQIDNVDHLQLITTNIQTYTPGSLYGGHPNPTRANPNGAGLFTDNGTTQVFRTLIYDPDGSTPGSTTDPSIGLPANWPPVQTANAVEGDWRGPTVTNPDGPEDNPVTIWGTNTNGIDEYTASNFGGAMQGDLLAGHNIGLIRRVELNPDGSLQNFTSSFLSLGGGNALGITCNSDTDVFPGTVWTGTLEGSISVFEPVDFLNCLEPGDAGYDPTADGDLDGYLNQDEVDNGTQVCNGGSQPSDFDKSVGGSPLISDLNDTDDDADGISDALDPFQLGNPDTGGSDAFTLPVFNDLFNSQQGLGGIFGLGMTGLMNNGDTGANWLDWLDVKGVGPNPDDVLGGAPGIMTSHMTDGTALGTSNDQDKGYQYGVQVDNTTGEFTVIGGMNGFTGPLRLYENTDGVTNGELGFFIGDGTQSNYIKFVVTTDGFTALQEINDVPGTPIQFTLPVGNRPTSGIRFYFIVDPATGSVDLEYQIDNNSRTSLGSITALGNVLQAIQTSGTELAVGFIGSSNTPGKELEGSWDFLNVEKTLPTTDVVARVNASGATVFDPVVGVDWAANLSNGSTSGTGYSVNTGWGYPSSLSYSNRHQSIPDEMGQATYEALFANERYDLPSNPVMEYSFPLPNDDYVVSIYAGNSYSGTSQVGQRVFDIMIEGQVMGNDVDLVTLFGHQAGGVLNYQAQVLDGELNIQFLHGVENPLLNAIEISRVSVQETPITVNPIANQTSTLNEVLDGSFAVVASGGDGSLTYSAIGLPPGISINTSNGQFNGTIAGSANTGPPYAVTVTVDDADTNTSDAVQVNFQWQITEQPTLSVVARVNASGALVIDPLSGIDWAANLPNGSTSGTGYSVNTGQGFDSNLSFANRHSSIPAEMDQATYETLFAQERYDLPSNPVMEYSFPLPNGDYLVNIYAGNSYSGTSQIGQRIFDIEIEGQLLGDNIDLVALFGHQSGGMLSYQTQVQDGVLNVQFIHGVENPLVNALEVLSSTTAQNPILVQPIADQNNNEGDILNGSLGVVASGGDGNLNFSMSGQPPGIFIEPTNGQIGGSVDLAAATGSPYTVSIVVDDSDGDASDSVTVNFNWFINPTGIMGWTDRFENESYEAKGESGFVQAGRNFFIIGGIENSTVYSYDFDTDSWANKGAAPLLFNHFQPIAYQGLIWVIGALKNRNFPNDSPSEYVWIYDPVDNVWFQGPQVPTNRVRGAAGLILHNNKFYVIGGNTNGHNGGYVPWLDEFDPHTGQWRTLPDAPHARDHFYAVEVNDKIYAIGGRLTGETGGFFGPEIAEVDVFDLINEQWSSLPQDQNIPTPRTGAPVAFFDDKIMVMGGEKESGVVYGQQVDSVALQITEGYNVINNTWSRLGDTVFPRHGTNAIVSGNGVYLASGAGGWGAAPGQANMEFYGEDSATGDVLVKSELTAPPSLLFSDTQPNELEIQTANGNTGIFIRSIEIIGADAGEFLILNGNLQNQLIAANSNHQMTLSTTNVQGPKNAILRINYGLNSSKDIVLDVFNSSWVDKDENENYTARHENSFVQAGDKFYLMGGRENSQTIDVYDYGTNTWNQLVNSVPAEFNHFQAIEYHGLIWVIGAFRTNVFPNEIPADYVWAFDPATNQWFQGPEIPSGRKRGSAGLALYNGKFYVVGGNTDGHDGGYVSWFDEYDPATGVWTTLSDAPRARDHFHAAVINGKLFIAGGRLSGGPGGVFAPTIAEVDVYDFATSSWSTLPLGQNLPTERAATATVNFQNKLLVIGGEGGGQAFDLTEQYDPVTQSWQTLDNLNYARHGTQALTSGGGVYILGGSPNQGGGNQKNMEYLGSDSATGSPSISSTLNGPSSVTITDDSSVNINLDVVGGTVGIFVDSMEITGPDAQDFSIVSGELSKAILAPSSNHAMNIALNGSGAGRNAVLTINYGASLSLTIDLSSSSTASDGVISFTLMNADTNTALFDLFEGQQVAINSLPTSNLNIRANTNPEIVGSVFFELTGTATNSRLENGAPYALFGDNSGNYFVGSLPEGSYSLTATAYNGSGQSGGVFGQAYALNFSMVSGAGGNQPPVAIASASAQTGEAPLLVDFTGSNSTDDAGIVAYSWDFKDGNSATLADPTHTFTAAGTYDVELTVTDAENETSSTTITITVSEPAINQPPVAVATASVLTGTAPLLVDFTGSNSTDDTGIVSYSWDFKDGNTSTFADTSHTFAVAGTYDVELTVTDVENETDATTLTIIVVEPAGNQPPVAVASASIQSGTVPLSVDFTGSNSTDDNGIVSYTWDFKDGNTSALADPSHSFTAAGNYDVELTVSDAENASSSITITITVNEPSTDGVIGLTLIDAVTDADLLTLTNGQQLDFGSAGGIGLNVRAETNPAVVGSVSFELSGPITSSRTEGVAPYALFGDVAGDFNPNDLPLGNYTLTATAYNGGGQSGGVLGQPYVVNFSIVDNNGGGNQTPMAVVTASTTSGQAPLSVDFTGSNSTDDNGIVSYLWDFKDGNTSTLADPSHTFTIAGTYDVALTVSDAENETDTANISISVTSGGVNAPPVVTNPGTQNNNEGESVSLQIVATDESANLAYEATNLPPDLAINPSTGQISGVITQGQSSGAFLESNGLIIVEAESDFVDTNTNAGWDIDSDGSTTFMEAHANHFSVSEVGETVTYDIQVSTPGVYRFHMKSEFSGSVASDENDTWFRIDNTSDIHFFCVSTDLVNTAEFEAYLGGGNIGKSVFYPAGNAQGRPDFGADNPGSNGYFKVFRNGDVVGGGNKWSAETIDFHSYAVYAYFPNPTTFTISMSERSAGHRVDRFALTQIDLQGPGEPATVLDGPQSSRGSGGVVGAAENSPYTVSVTVTDTGIPQEATTIQFDWIVGTDTGGGNPGIETIESFTLVNAVTNTDLFDITDGMQIQESTIQGIGLNIRANTNPLVVGSVSFNLSGPISANQTENGAPYALFGDAAGDYFGNILPIGSYTLSATPYPNSSLGGVPGETVTVQFTITAVGNSILPNDSLEENITVLLSPNPTSYEVNVVTQPITNIRKVHIFDVTGRLVRTMEIDEQLSKSGQFGFDVLGIEDGVYIIQMLSNSNQKISEHRLVIRQ